MHIDDLVMVSIDDHVVEPPNMFEGHVPAKWADEAPRVVVGENGVDQWVYRGRPTGVSGLNAVVSWPAEEWGRDPAGFDEMRPGVYDVHERVRDMNRNGILASMCFPTFTGFSAGHLSHFKDDITVAMIQAYNDWHIDEWDGAYPGRFVPLAIIPTWDSGLAVDEIRRVAAKGCSAITMPELPHIEGLPSYHDMTHWGPVLEALCDALAASGGMEHLPDAFRQPEPLDVLNQYLLVFSRFWDADRLVTRRLRALAALDPDFEQVIRARDERRRQGVRVITQRLVEQQILSPSIPHDEIVDVLFTLSSFETFDTLAGPTRSLQEVAPLVCRLARATLHLNNR